MPLAWLQHVRSSYRCLRLWMHEFLHGKLHTSPHLSRESDRASLCLVVFHRRSRYSRWFPPSLSISASPGLIYPTRMAFPVIFKYKMFSCSGEAPKLSLWQTAHFAIVPNFALVVFSRAFPCAFLLSSILLWILYLIKKNWPWRMPYECSFLSDFPHNFPLLSLSRLLSLPILCLP